MPYIFVSTVALFSNLYRCSPLVVGDKDSDKELMDFLGAKYTTDYPGHKSPVYVIYATPRSLMDALQTKGFSLISTQMFEDYITWTFSSPLKKSEDGNAPAPVQAKTVPPKTNPTAPTQTAATPLSTDVPPSQQTAESRKKTPMNEPVVAYSDEGSSKDRDLERAASSSSKASRFSTKSLSSARKKMDFKETPDQSAVARPKYELYKLLKEGGEWL